MIQIKRSFTNIFKENAAGKTVRSLAVGAIIEGSKNNNIKTGDWSVKKPIIDKKLCIDCGICRQFCPEDAIGENGINYYYCKGCGICTKVCPKKAIKMK